MFKVFKNFQNYIKMFQEGGTMEDLKTPSNFNVLADSDIGYLPTSTNPIDNVQGYKPQFRPYAASFIPISNPSNEDDPILSPYYEKASENNSAQINPNSNIETATNNFPTGKLSLDQFVATMKPIVDAGLRRAGIDTKFSPMLLANMSIETGNRLSGSPMYNQAFNFSGIHSNKAAIQNAGYKYYGRTDYSAGTIVPGAGVGGRDAIYVPHGPRNDGKPHTSW